MASHRLGNPSLGRRHLDRRDVAADLLVVVVLVDLPGRSQDEQAELLHLDPAVGYLLLGHLQVRESPASDRS